MRHCGSSARRTQIEKGFVSQRAIDLWALRLVEHTRIWEDIRLNDCYNSDDLFRFDVFRRFRAEVNFAVAVSANIEFLETGDKASGRFLLRSGFVRPAAARLRDGDDDDEAQDAASDTALFGKEDLSSENPLPKAERLDYLRLATAEAIEDFDGIAELRPGNSRSNPDTIGDLWKRVFRDGAVRKQLGSENPKTFQAAIAALEDALKKGEPAFTGPFAENIDEIEKAFGFSELESDIFRFILAGCANNLLSSILYFFDFSQAGTDLIIDVIAVGLKEPSEKIKAAFDPESALIRSGLIAFEETNDEDFESRFRFLDADKFRSLISTRLPLEALIASTVVPAEKSELSIENFAHLPTVRRVLIPYIRDAAETKRVGVNVLLYGLPGTGKTQLARMTADALGLKLYEIATDMTENRLPRLQRWKTATAFLAGAPNALIAIDEAEDVFNANLSRDFDDRRTNKGEINKLLETNPVPTFWITNRINAIDPAMIRRFDLILEVPTPDAESRRQIVEKAFSHQLSETVVARLVETPQLAPAVLKRASAVASAVGFARGAISEEDVVAMIGETLRAQRFGDVADKGSLLPAFYDPSFVNADLDLAALAQGLKAAGCGRLCLYGPPGTGKSAYAAWLAKTLNRPLVRRTVADLTSCFVGETEKRIAAAFRSARRENAVLLFDEADSFLRDRTLAVRSWETTEVNEMLAQLESFDGYFIATTNLLDALDPASMRRFDLKAKFDYLREAQAEALARKVLERFDLTLDEEAAARLRMRRNLTPGDFAAVCRQAAFRRLESAADFVRRLEEEAKLKGSSGAKIGFWAAGTFENR